MVKFIEEVSEQTGISWWDENRRKLNEAIRWYNEFIGTHNRSSEMVLAKVDQIRRYGESNDFSDWQYDILNEIESKVKEAMQ